MNKHNAFNVRMRFIKSLIFSQEENWQIAIRVKGNQALYEKGNSPFFLIPNSIRYWRADPFLLDHEGKTFLFAEMYDRKQEKGVIGVSEVKNGKCSGFSVCLEEPYHLSYPCVFKQEESIYMIPEACKSNRITVYKSLRFPYEWEKKYVLSECKGSDTTPVFSMGTNCNETWFLTTLYSYTNKHNDNLHFLSKDSPEPALLRNNDTTVRSGGHIIVENSKLIRPTQDDGGGDNGYGNSLYFKIINRLTPEELDESIILQVLPPRKSSTNSSVSVQLMNHPNSRTFEGVHTYNSCKKYEVIDLKYYSNFSIYPCYRKIRNYFKSKFKRQVK